MSLRVIPLTLAQANTLVGSLHRHHKPAVGHRFSIGVVGGGKLVGAAIVGRPVARMVDQNNVAEVTRLVTDGTKNACSILYAAAARAAKDMGFVKIQTYILESEPGTSLLAAGWIDEGPAGGGDWNRPNLLAKGRKPNRTDQPMTAKRRYAKYLNEPVEIAA